MNPNTWSNLPDPDCRYPYLRTKDDWDMWLLNIREFAGRWWKYINIKTGPAPAPLKPKPVLYEHAVIVMGPNMPKKFAELFSEERQNYFFLLQRHHFESVEYETYAAAMDRISMRIKETISSESFNMILGAMSSLDNNTLGPFERFRILQGYFELDDAYAYHGYQS